MRVLLVAVLSAVVAACGDNGSTTPTTERCEPPASALPTTGMYIDPYAIELPADCVEGGLRDLPGRWFVRDPSSFFTFDYPKFEGTCETGFKRFGAAPVDQDESDPNKYTHYVWSDGTRFFDRVRYVIGPNVEYVRATVTCVRPDDTLAQTIVRYTSDNGSERISKEIGERFAPADDLAAGLEKVGELGAATGGPTIEGLNLVVENNIAYMVGLDGFDTFDVSNPAAPVLLGHIDGYLNDVRIAHGGGKTVAFAASEGGDDRVWVIDVTDPAAPDFVSVIPEYAHSLQIRTTTGGTTELFLANYSATIPRYDVTNPLSPVKTGTAVLPGQTISGIHDLTVYGDRIYANNTEAGCVALDVSANYNAPVEIGRKMSAYSHASWAANINGKEIVLHGDEGMTGTSDGAAFLRVLDGDPQSPTFMQDIGRYQTRKQVGIHNIEVHGTKAYIAYYQDGVRIVELADPTNPVEVAHYNTWDPETNYGSGFEGAVGARKVGDYIYVADIARGLIILREL